MPKIESITDLAADDSAHEEQLVLVRNAEQQDMIDVLGALVDDANAMLRLAGQQAAENESLHREVLVWSDLRVDVAERWLDNTGALGYRVFVVGAHALATRLFAFISDKLRDAGWDNVLVCPA